MVNGRNKQAVKVIRKAGKRNGISDENITSVIARFFSADDKVENSTDVLSKEEKEPLDSKLNETVEQRKKTEANVSALALVTHPKLRRITLVMFLAW